MMSPATIVDPATHHCTCVGTVPPVKGREVRFGRFTCTATRQSHENFSSKVKRHARDEKTMKYSETRRLRVCTGSPRAELQHAVCL